MARVTESVEPGIEESYRNQAERGGAFRLSELPAERWEKLRADLPQILADLGPTIPNQLAHLPATTEPELVVAYLYRDGGVIIDKVVSEEACDAIVREMQPYIDDTSYGKETATGKATKRTGALVSRSKASWEIVGHPLLLDSCQGVLGHQLLHEKKAGGDGNAPGYEKQHPWQLNLTQIIQVGPGEPAQPLHRDRWIFISEEAFTKSKLEPEISTIWALTEFTLDKGPTRVVPGSHRWPSDHEKPKAEEAAHAVMNKGSVVIYTGSVWHSAGNNVGAEPRIGLNIDYCLAWLRQEENQYLACPPSVAKDLPVKLQNLIGYTAVPAGYFDGLLSPKKSFSERPVNWASDWQGYSSKL